MAAPLFTPTQLLGSRTTQEQNSELSTPDKQRISINAERISFLKRLVNDAVKEHRVFTIRGGWQTLRKALLKRNWVEKLDVPKVPPKTAVLASNSSEDICSNLPARQSWETPSAHIIKCERMIMSRLLQFHDVDFYWNTKKDLFDMHLRLNCHKLVNRFSRSLFTSKEGLCLLLQQMYWHTEPGVASVNFPRCYVLGFPDHYNNFVDDFRITACISLVKFVINKYDKEDKYVIQSPEGKVPFSTMQFAIDRLNEYLAMRKHIDIDVIITEIDKTEWEDFLGNFNKVVHEQELFLEDKLFSLNVLIATGRIASKNLEAIWPQMALDGMKNIWIMKPGNKCRGRGIQLIKDIKDVDKVMELKLKYVVQKYIERPLIIYDTKFDIRQWFMITSVQPLHIWMYRDSYLRFSSQNFSLNNFHESLHLTNHAVQCKYKNTNDRNQALPDENMWDCHVFKKYLKDIGHENKWDMVIFPGMKESIIGAMLACQETMDRRPNTFELYGADFILAEDFHPWLLEINSSPDLSSSTSVTARMCPQCLEDLVKVVIDRRKEANCDTGLFEVIYRQNLPRAPAYLGMNLQVRGRRIFKKNKQKKDKENECKKRPKNPRLSAPEKSSGGSSSPGLVQRYSGPVIADLIEEIQKKMENDSDDSDGGVEVAKPITAVRKSGKTDRVAKVQTFRNKSNVHCSNSRKLKGGESCKSSGAPPVQQQQQQPQPIRTRRSSRTSRSKAREKCEWTLSRSTVNFSKNDATDDDAVVERAAAILKGKCVNNSTNKSHLNFAISRSNSFNFSMSKVGKDLLTVGYRFGTKNINRPCT